MLDLALKNIRKQRTRTLLTVIGIVVGITAIVALGSFSEGISAMVQEELGDLAGKITVVQKGSMGVTSGFIGSSVTQEQMDAVKAVSGVKDVVPVVWYYDRRGSFGPPEWFAVGANIDDVDIFLGRSIAMDSGFRYEPGERDVAMAGSDVAERMNLRAGDFFDIKGNGFFITGIIERTGTSDVDSAIIVPLEDLQTLLGTDGYQVLYVVAERPEQTEAIADDIVALDDTLEALTSKEIARQMSGILGNVRIFTIGVGAIATIVGGLGVMNTMIMAVMERRRELGVMRAIGAPRRLILFQILTESSLISLAGGVAGIALGSLASVGLSVAFGGSVKAVVTPALALGSLAFALALGLTGGAYPAWKAASLDPMEALRG